MFVGHDSQVPRAGDYYTTQLGTEPVILVRHSDGEVRGAGANPFGHGC
jgi:phenylpropionate dioxygenase-like ring-hydroxylating dioxygenase large terminal subunit